MMLHSLALGYSLLSLCSLLLVPAALADVQSSQSAAPSHGNLLGEVPLEDFDDFGIFDIGSNSSVPLEDFDDFEIFDMARNSSHALGDDDDLTHEDSHHHHHHHHHHPTGPINATHCHQSCSLTINDKHPKHQREIWRREAAGIWLDGWVAQYPVGWSQKLYKLYTKGDMDCSTIDNNDCQGIDHCLKWCHQASPAVYWILKSVSKLNTATAYIHEAFQDNAFKESLTGIDRIVSDFDLEEPTVNPYAVAGASFGIASGAAFAIGPLAGVLGIISGSFGIAAQSYQPPDPTLPMKEQLSAYFTHTEHALRDTLKNAVGSGNQDKLPMAARTDKYDYKTPTGQFFAGGKLLFNDAFKTLQPVIKKGKQVLVSLTPTRLSWKYNIADAWFFFRSIAARTRHSGAESQRLSRHYRYWHRQQG